MQESAIYIKAIFLFNGHRFPAAACIDSSAHPRKEALFIGSTLGDVGGRSSTESVMISSHGCLGVRLSHEPFLLKDVVYAVVESLAVYEVTHCYPVFFDTEWVLRHLFTAPTNGRLPRDLHRAGLLSILFGDLPPPPVYKTRSNSTPSRSLCLQPELVAIEKESERVFLQKERDGEREKAGLRDVGSSERGGGSSTGRRPSDAEEAGWWSGAPSSSPGQQRAAPPLAASLPASARLPRTFARRGN
ncbi:hypothetical protein MRX96_039561 [Rhipicephalus microplus]